MDEEGLGLDEVPAEYGLRFVFELIVRRYNKNNNVRTVSPIPQRYARGLGEGRSAGGSTGHSSVLAASEEGRSAGA
jgi:hypothetical protein